MKELAYRVFQDNKPIGAFPNLWVADEYARRQVDREIGSYCESELQETGFHVGRYVEAERVACPMIRYVLTPNGIERYGATKGSPHMDQVRFERVCVQLAAISEMFAEQRAKAEPAGARNNLPDAVVE